MKGYYNDEGEPDAFYHKLTGRGDAQGHRQGRMARYW